MTDTLETYEGKATIHQHDNAIPATIEYRSEQERIYTGPDDNDWLPGLRTWQGTISTGTRIDTGNATLELPDGRKASIVIHGYQVCDVTALGSTWKQTALTIEAEFTGTGKAP